MWADVVVVLDGSGGQKTLIDVEENLEDPSDLWLEVMTVVDIAKEMNNPILKPKRLPLVTHSRGNNVNIEQRSVRNVCFQIVHHYPYTWPQSFANHLEDMLTAVQTCVYFSIALIILYILTLNTKAPATSPSFFTSIG